VSVLAIKNAEMLVTMDENRHEISNGTVIAEHNKIKWLFTKLLFHDCGRAGAQGIGVPVCLEFQPPRIAG
jgi:hypothetical protein